MFVREGLCGQPGAKEGLLQGGHDTAPWCNAPESRVGGGGGTRRAEVDRRVVAAEEERCPGAFLTNPPLAPREGGVRSLLDRASGPRDDPLPSCSRAVRSEEGGLVPPIRKGGSRTPLSAPIPSLP